MEPKVSYTLVGAFVLVFGAVLIVIVLWLVKKGPQVRYRDYRAYFRESVSGLNENAAVKYKGVNVGRVKEIRLDPQDPERVRLTLEIDAGAPIKEDTVATLGSQGLTGLAFVELSGGTREAPLLEARPGEDVPVIRTRPSLFMRLDQSASTLLANLNRVAESMAELTDEEGRRSLRQIVRDVGHLAAGLKEREKQLGQLFASADRTLESAREVTAELPALVARVSRAVGALEEMAEQIGRTGKTVDAMVAGSREDVRRFTNETLAETGVLVADLRRLTERLQRIAREVEQNPRSLLFGRRPPPPGPGE
ncbi:MAG TPA: MlaD family protein [candidate division Zixibacteria bacterium]|nr:MlaD family protein [candidate division Zixibacteria bacterium]